MVDLELYGMCTASYKEKLRDIFKLMKTMEKKSIRIDYYGKTYYETMEPISHVAQIGREQRVK